MFGNEVLVARWRVDGIVEGARVAQENFSEAPWSKQRLKELHFGMWRVLRGRACGDTESTFSAYLCIRRRRIFGNVSKKF